MASVDCPSRKPHTRKSEPARTAQIASLQNCSGRAYIVVLELEVKDGLRELCVNLLSGAGLRADGFSEDDDEWAESIISVDDGGFCFWRMGYDLTGLRPNWVYINGEG